MGHFEKLLRVVRERGGNGPGGGRPWCLPLAEWVLLVAVYFRTYLTMRQLAPLFGCSPAIVCRASSVCDPCSRWSRRPGLVVASARPAPGNKADARVWRESVLPTLAAGTTVIADGAYLGTGLIVPHRRRAGRPLLRGQEEDNAEHRRVRARVEHTFARMKNWKVLRDCRQQGDGLHHAVQAVATMHNLAMAG
jgi:hypothetical protein